MSFDSERGQEEKEEEGTSEIRRIQQKASKPKGKKNLNLFLKPTKNPEKACARYAAAELQGPAPPGALYNHAVALTDFSRIPPSGGSSGDGGGGSDPSAAPPPPPPPRRRRSRGRGRRGCGRPRQTTTRRSLRRALLSLLLLQPPLPRCRRPRTPGPRAAAAGRQRQQQPAGAQQPRPRAPGALGARAARLAREGRAGGRRGRAVPGGGQGQAGLRARRVQPGHGALRVGAPRGGGGGCTSFLFFLGALQRPPRRLLRRRRRRRGSSQQRQQQQRPGPRPSPTRRSASPWPRRWRPPRPSTPAAWRSCSRSCRCRGCAPGGCWCRTRCRWGPLPASSSSSSPGDRSPPPRQRARSSCPAASPRSGGRLPRPPQTSILEGALRGPEQHRSCFLSAGLDKSNGSPEADRVDRNAFSRDGERGEKRRQQRVSLFFFSSISLTWTRTTKMVSNCTTKSSLFPQSRRLFRAPPRIDCLVLLILVLSRRDRGRTSLNRYLSLRKATTMLRALLVAAALFLSIVGIAGGAAAHDPNNKNDALRQQPDCDSAVYQKSSLTLLSSKKFAAMYLRAGHMRQFEGSGISIGPTGKGEEFLFFPFLLFFYRLLLKKKKGTRTFFFTFTSVRHKTLSLSLSLSLPPSPRSRRRLRQLARPWNARLPAGRDGRAPGRPRRVAERLGRRRVEGRRRRRRRKRRKKRRLKQRSRRQSWP